MSAIFLHLENSKTSYLYKLRHDLTDKMDLQRGDKRVASPDLVSTTHGRI